MNDTPERPEATNKPKPWRWAVYLALLAMAVCSALLIHEKYEYLVAPASQPSRRRALDLSALRRRTPASRRAAASRPTSRGVSPDVASDLAAIIGEVIDAGNLPALDRDPGELTPPDQAVRLWARWREAHGHRHEFGRYEWPGTVEQGALHYGSVLPDKGFRCLRESRPADGTIRLEYIKGETYVVVTLLRQRRDAKMSEIAVVVLTAQE